MQQNSSLSTTERKLLESLFEEMIYGKEFHAGEGYKASIVRAGERAWDEQGRLRAILSIEPTENRHYPWPNLSEMETYPIYLSAQIHEDDFIGGVKVCWDMPESAWGVAQSGIWTDKPFLKNPDEDPLNLTERYEVRMHPALKQWTIEHGGAGLIRALLRAERQRQS